MNVASLAASETRVKDAVAALARGEMVLLIDRSEEAEGGHLVAAAQTISAETIATMLREAVGMPWIALPDDRCEALGLTSMGGESRRGRRDMLVTIEAREGVSTGISAADRALTMRVAADAGSTGADVVSPGHVLPVRVAADGPPPAWGAAEAAVELAALAGRPGGATVCQVMDEDGLPATEPNLGALAARISVPAADSLDLLDQRLTRTALVDRAGDERTIDSAVGPLRCVSYLDSEHGALHYAFVVGEVAGTEAVRAEAVEQDIPADVFAAPQPGSNSRLEASLADLAAAGKGILLYLAPAPAADAADSFLSASRRAHLVTQIFRDLGVSALLAPSR